MQPNNDVETLLTSIASLPREELVHTLRNYPCPFPIDFTDSYLQTLPIERLKHLVAAVALHCRKNTHAA